MAGRSALVASVIALLIALWSANQVATRPPPSTSPVTVAWASGVRRVLLDLDRRLTIVEREIMLRTDDAEKRKETVP